MSDLQSVYDALVQAKDCINGETPEDITFGEAEDDTLSKIRDAMRTVEALLNAPAQQTQEPTHFQKVIDHVISNDDSPLGRMTAERDYALHALEREISICQETQKHADELVEQLALADALISTHANSIDSSHPSTWPAGSILAAAVKRHSARCAFPSTSRATPTYCAHCDHEHQLHEDAQGFHHVIRGERVACCTIAPAQLCTPSSAPGDGK